LDSSVIGHIVAGTATVGLGVPLASLTVHTGGKFEFAKGGGMAFSGGLGGWLAKKAKVKAYMLGHIGFGQDRNALEQTWDHELGHLNYHYKVGGILFPLIYLIDQDFFDYPNWWWENMPPP
jgi:hypothetical protein